MKWFWEDDRTRPVFTAAQHIASKHVSGPVCRLPRRAVAFCLGRGLPLVRERWETRTVMERLPGFITHSPVLAAAGHEDVCFVDGGRGAPQAVCTVETLHALGVKELLVVGLCGAFGEEIQVCDVLLPRRIRSEEGASRHYFAAPDMAAPDSPWSEEFVMEFLRGRGLTVKQADTVTTDAVYRQTFRKEACWREMGFSGVDMEASAMVNLCRYYGMKSTVLFMASDKHPATEGAPAWNWGNSSFRESQDAFLLACVSLALEGPKGKE